MHRTPQPSPPRSDPAHPTTQVKMPPPRVRLPHVIPMPPSPCHLVNPAVRALTIAEDAGNAAQVAVTHQAPQGAVTGRLGDIPEHHGGHVTRGELAELRHLPHDLSVTGAEGRWQGGHRPKSVTEFYRYVNDGKARGQGPGGRVMVRTGRQSGAYRRITIYA